MTDGNRFDKRQACLDAVKQLDVKVMNPAAGRQTRTARVQRPAVMGGRAPMSGLANALAIIEGYMRENE